MDLCRANYPDYNTDYFAKGVLWMDEFIKQPDDLMETAIRSCITFGKKFPTIADIREAIRDLQYDEQVKPKQIPWDVKRDYAISARAVKFVKDGRSAEYMASVDITKLRQYAKYYFPEISDELIRKNYSEVVAGMESVERCSACRTCRNECFSKGYVTKMRLHTDGYMTIEMQACEKNKN